MQLILSRLVGLEGRGHDDEGASLVGDELSRDLEVERVLRALDDVLFLNEQRAPLGVGALVRGRA